jgi:glycosyltransferase involved in cell wall biosynthesis
MKKVLINGVSAKSAGGQSILTNLLSSISNKSSNNYYIVIVPPNMNYEKFGNENIWIITYDDSRISFFRQAYFYFFFVKRIVKTYKVSLIFNTADIIIPVKTKQLFLFDWSYAVYPESSVWKKMGLLEFLHRKVKLYVFKMYISFPETIYAQTNSIKIRLNNLYNLDNTSIMPNAVSVENIKGGTFRDFQLPLGKFNFLCLCKYYVHKNLEILVPVAKLIKAQSLPFQIVVTIEKDQNRKAKNLLNIIEKEKLNDIIINVGSVDMQHVPSLYRQSSALLLPTLLESFSGTYVEAMFHRKPIFTSNLDFAQDVCGEYAVYFEPLDPSSIIEAMKNILNNSLIENIVERSSIRLTGFLTWDDVAEKMLNELNKNL